MDTTLLEKQSKKNNGSQLGQKVKLTIKNYRLFHVVKTIHSLKKYGLSQTK